MRGLRRSGKLVGLGVAAAVMVAGCGSPATVSEEAGAGSGSSTATESGASASSTEESGTGQSAGGGGGTLDNSADLQAVYDQIAGLEGEERKAKLIEIAADEEPLSIYSSTNIDDAEPLLGGFEGYADIEPSYYRASSSDVLQRILQESAADYAGNDIVLVNGPEMAIMANEGLLLPLESPYKAAIVEAANFDTWAGVYLNVFVAGWNDGLADPPSTWEDVLTNYNGRLGMELGDWDWFATLTKNYFMGEKGMTEDEVVAMFKKAAAGAKVVDGHTLMAQLLTAGEFELSTSLYHHRVEEMISEGAPIEWKQPKPVSPMVIRPNGVGIVKTVKNPASALLWVDFVLTEGQEILVKEHRTPASTEVEGGLSNEYDPITVDIAAVTDERDHWEALYEEIVRESGSDVASG